MFDYQRETVHRTQNTEHLLDKNGLCQILIFLSNTKAKLRHISVNENLNMVDQFCQKSLF